MQANWFIAFPVSVEGDTGAWFHNLPPLPTNSRKFHPDDLHITVAFLGGVSEEAARAAWAALPALPTATRALLREVKGMGNPKEPSAWSVMVEAPGLAHEIGRLRQPAYTASACRADQRPPLAHMTLGRPERSATRQDRQAGLDWCRGVRIHNTEVQIDSIALYTWAADRGTQLFDKVEHRALPV